MRNPFLQEENPFLTNSSENPFLEKTSEPLQEKEETIADKVSSFVEEYTPDFIKDTVNDITGDAGKQIGDFIGDVQSKQDEAFQGLSILGDEGVSLLDTGAELGTAAAKGLAGFAEGTRNVIVEAIVSGFSGDYFDSSSLEQEFNRGIDEYPVEIKGKGSQAIMAAGEAALLPVTELADAAAEWQYERAQSVSPEFAAATAALFKVLPDVALTLSGANSIKNGFKKALDTEKEILDAAEEAAETVTSTASESRVRPAKESDEVTLLKYQDFKEFSNQFKEKLGLKPGDHLTPEQHKAFTAARSAHREQIDRNNFARQYAKDFKTYKDKLPKTADPLTRWQKSVQTLSRQVKGADEFRKGLIKSAVVSLEEIDVDLRNAYRFEHADTLRRIGDDQAAAKDYIEIAQKIEKKDPKLLNELDIAVGRGHWKVAEDLIIKSGIVSKSMSKDNISVTQMMAELKNMLEHRGRQAKENGINMNLLDDYFPRELSPNAVQVLRDKAKELGLDPSVADKIEKVIKDTELNEFERVSEINKIVGRTRVNAEKIGADPGHSKERTIDNELLPALINAYKPSYQALNNYISEINNAIEAKRIYGKYSKLEEGTTDLGKTIGGIIEKKRQAGREFSEQEFETIDDMFRTIYIDSKKHPVGAFRFLTNAGIFSALGDVRQALTQLKDIPLAAMRAGTVNTFGAMGKVMGKPIRKKGDTITLEDLGVQSVLREFDTSQGVSHVISELLKYTGFRAVDKLGKTVAVNAIRDKYKKGLNGNIKQQTKTQAELREKYGTFIDDWDGFIANMKNGNMDDPNVKSVIVDGLFDLQPITQGDLPQSYLKNPNARIFYSLQTYTMNQVNLLRRDVYREFKAGRSGKATKNAMRYLGLLAAGGASVDTVKDLMLNLFSGEEITAETIGENVSDNLMAFIPFLSRYTIEQTNRQGLVDTAQDAFTPVAIKRFQRYAEDPAAAWSEVPIIGDEMNAFFKQKGIMGHDKPGRESRRNVKNGSFFTGLNPFPSEQQGRSGRSERESTR